MVSKKPTETDNDPELGIGATIPSPSIGRSTVRSGQKPAGPKHDAEAAQRAIKALRNSPDQFEDN